MSKEKTFKVAMAELHSQYYVVKAVDEDQAFVRAYNYDENEEWALDTYDAGIESQEHAFTEEEE